MINNDVQDKVYVDLILKLYEQTEKATEKIDTEITGLRNVTSNMIEILKSSVTNEQIIERIKDSNKKLEPTLKEVEKIHEKCKLHSEDVKNINNKLSTLSNWVKTMITVVLITFSLLTVSYYYTRSSIENMVKKEFKSSEIQRGEQSISGDERLDELQKQFDEIRRELIKQKRIDK